MCEVRREGPYVQNVPRVYLKLPIGTLQSPERPYYVSQRSGAFQNWALCRALTGLKMSLCFPKLGPAGTLGVAGPSEPLRQIQGKKKIENFSQIVNVQTVA